MRSPFVKRKPGDFPEPYTEPAQPEPYVPSLRVFYVIVRQHEQFGVTVFTTHVRTASEYRDADIGSDCKVWEVGNARTKQDALGMVILRPHYADIRAVQ